MSERRACRVLGQARAVQRHTPRVRDDEEPLVGRMVELAAEYGRYGYAAVTALLRAGGLGGEPQAGRAALAAGGPEGAAEAAQARAAVAERRAAACGCGRSTRTTSGATTS